MSPAVKLAATAALAILACGSLAHAKTLSFAGYHWTVKSGTGIGPGPNDWADDNVWVDKRGALHLKLTHHGGGWHCSQVVLSDRLGFGRYQFWIVGRIDQLDPNVVFGLFSYPTPDLGPDGTNEIDIEFAQWGRADAKRGNYTVWPATKGTANAHDRFAFQLNGSYTTHRVIWTPTSVFFQSLNGHQDGDANEFARWFFQPSNPRTQLAQQPMPIEINLWLFRGRPPQNNQEVEVIVQAFKFTPALD